MWSLTSAFNACSKVNFAESSNSTKLGDCQGPDCDSGCLPTAESCGPGTYPVSEEINVADISSKADVLIVIDDSGSMSQENQELANRMDGLVQILEQGGVDWQMCYTTANPNSGGTQQWIGSNGQGTGSQVLSSRDPNSVNIFRSTMDQFNGSGNGDEQAIRSSVVSVKSNSSCFRNDAALSVVVLSDEDEHSCAGRCQNTNDNAGIRNHEMERYTNQYKQMGNENRPQALIEAVKDRWPQKPLTVHSIVIQDNDLDCLRRQDQDNPAFFGTTYSDLSRRTAGIKGDICAASYADQLKSMGQRIRDSLNSITLKCVPINVPEATITPNPGAYKQTVNGNKMFFEPALPPGTRVALRYHCRD